MKLLVRFFDYCAIDYSEIVSVIVEDLDLGGLRVFRAGFVVNDTNISRKIHDRKATSVEFIKRK